jgi:hypothetical protein
MSEEVSKLVEIVSEEAVADNLSEIKSDNKLKKVILQYEDHVRYLEGEDAEKWDYMCNQLAAFANLHQKNPFASLPLDWKYNNENKESLDKRDTDGQDSGETEEIIGVVS